MKSPENVLSPHGETMKSPENILSPHGETMKSLENVLSPHGETLNQSEIIFASVAGITLLTVTLRSLHAANENPVKSIKSE